ncbi:MAG: TlyA family RNA methyltransferase [Firmicutes bacterium]|nr:TlyA family RNA methyltransferase [Bacillota bacterium]
MRLDVLLVQKGYFVSRQRAQEAIRRGYVSVNGRIVKKPAFSTPLDAALEVEGPAWRYPSRAGLKLEKAIKLWQLDLSGLTALDVGASAGGFTSCLLQNGVRHVYAVDVGQNQLAQELQKDPRVTVLDKTNIRYLRPEHLADPADLATIDVSFISLRKVFPAVRGLLTPKGQIIALVKPQFETEGRGLNKSGVINNPGIHLEFLPPLINHLQQADFGLEAFDFSPLTGTKGNLEYLAYFKRGISFRDSAAVVKKAIKAGWQYHRGM